MPIRLLDYLFGRVRTVGVSINDGELTYACGYYHKGVLYIEHQATIDYVPGMLVPLPRGYRITDVCDIRFLGIDP